MVLGAARGIWLSSASASASCLASVRDRQDSQVSTMAAHNVLWHAGRIQAQRCLGELSQRLPGVGHCREPTDGLDAQQGQLCLQDLLHLLHIKEAREVGVHLQRTGGGDLNPDLSHAGKLATMLLMPSMCTSLKPSPALGQRDRTTSIFSLGADMSPETELRDGLLGDDVRGAAGICLASRALILHNYAGEADLACPATWSR